MNRPVNPDDLRKWASTVEQRLGSTLWQEIAHTMHAVRRCKDIFLRRKCADDLALINDGGWKHTGAPCSCGWGEHNVIEVNNTQMCPIDVYLRLGRLALWGYRETPTLELFWSLLDKEQPENDKIRTT